MREVSKESKPVSLGNVDIDPYRNYLGPAFFSGIPTIGPIHVSDLADITPYLDRGFSLASQTSNGEHHYLDNIVLMYDRCIDFDERIRQ